MKKITLTDLKNMVVEATDALSDHGSLVLEKPTKQQLNETTLSRVKDNIENKNIPFVMLTAHRGVDKDLPPAEQDKQREINNDNQRKLKVRLKASGFPWVDMHRSGYKQGGPKGVVVEEYSVVVKVFLTQRECLPQITSKIHFFMEVQIETIQKNILFASILIPENLSKTFGLVAIKDIRNSVSLKMPKPNIGL